MESKPIPRPIGARILVEELVTSLSVRERGKRAGLTIITNEDDELKNNCTMGLVVAIGTDPFIKDELGIVPGKIVYFNRHDGIHTNLEGKRYRTLEAQHITNVLDEMPSDARKLSDLEAGLDI